MILVVDLYFLGRLCICLYDDQRSLFHPLRNWDVWLFRWQDLQLPGYHHLLATLRRDSCPGNGWRAVPTIYEDDQHHNVIISHCQAIVKPLSSPCHSQHPSTERFKNLMVVQELLVRFGLRSCATLRYKKRAQSPTCVRTKKSGHPQKMFHGTMKDLQIWQLSAVLCCYLYIYMSYTRIYRKKIG